MKKFSINFLVFLTILGIIITLLGFKLKDGLKFNSVYYEYRWDQFYKCDSNIDLLFIGSSHAYRSLIPSVFDSILNVNSFNLGSASQSTQTSFYVLKEAIRNNKPKVVVLEVFPATISNYDNFGNALINFDNIKSLDIRTELILTSDNYSDLIEVFIPAYRYNNYLTTLFKDTPSKNIAIVHKGLKEEYSDKGYVKTIISDTTFKYVNKFDTSKIDKFKFSEKNIKSIYNIALMCKENNIELILATQSLNPVSFNLIKNYNVFHNLLDSIANQNNIKYIDGNYHPEIGLTYEDYYDSGHMLYSGAVKFSTWFANELKDSEQ